MRRPVKDIRQLDLWQVPVDVVAVGRHGGGPVEDGSAMSAIAGCGALSDEALLDSLGEALANPRYRRGRRFRAPLRLLVTEAGRRRLSAALPLTLLLLSGEAGRDCVAATGKQRQPTLAEVAAGVLAELGGEAAIKALIGVVTSDNYAQATMVRAVEGLVALRAAAASALVDGLLVREEPHLRRAGCQLAGALELVAAIPRLEIVRSDDSSPFVAICATLALGQIGWVPIKPLLELCLTTASPVDLPAVLEAVRRLADGDTAVLIGRVIARMNEAGRLCAIDVLADIIAPEAVVVLERLVADCSPVIRAAVGRALVRMIAGGAGSRAEGLLALLCLDLDGEAQAVASTEP